MCGIVGYVGPRKVTRPAARRAWSSSSTAGTTAPASRCWHGDRIDAVRAVGNLSALRAAIDVQIAPIDAADRGPERGCARRAPQPDDRDRPHALGDPRARSPSENAHPHSDTTDRIHVVVNGIVENYVELKDELVRWVPSSRRRPTPR